MQESQYAGDGVVGVWVVWPPLLLPVARPNNTGSLSPLNQAAFSVTCCRNSPQWHDYAICAVCAVDLSGDGSRAVCRDVPARQVASSIQAVKLCKETMTSPRWEQCRDCRFQLRMAEELSELC